MINEFRKKQLGLRPVTYLSGSYSSPLNVPYAYIWSPHLVPKPKGQFPALLNFLIFFLVIIFEKLILKPMLVEDGMPDKI